MQGADTAVDAVLVGDSFTYGSCVSDGDESSSRLRQKGFHTINFGQVGNGPLIQLATIREYVTPLRPKYVFWMYYTAMIFRLI